MNHDPYIAIKSLATNFENQVEKYIILSCFIKKIAVLELDLHESRVTTGCVSPEDRKTWERKLQEESQ